MPLANHPAPLRCVLLILTILNGSCTSTSLRPNTEANIEVNINNKAEARGQKWVVSTHGRHTTEIAKSILKSSGNLIDAAIAASFAISVERPHSTGIGGGGFLIYHEAKSGKNFVYDFRERAPERAKKDMYLDKFGNVIPNLSSEGALSIGTPGLVRGLARIHRLHGTKKWADLVLPAANLARNGYEIYPELARAISESKDTLLRFPASAEIFLNQDPLTAQWVQKKLNEKLIQTDLANTLTQVSKDPSSFYTGDIAKKIITAIQKEKGALSLNDLKHYSVRTRQAIQAQWLGYDIVSMPPPSSGGIHVVQILKLLEKMPLNSKQQGLLGARDLHQIASCMQIAFADRAVHLGDPDFVSVPKVGLIHPAYLDKRRQEITLSRARSQKEVAAGPAHEFEEETQTTHFSMMDQAGNVVVSTQTINGWFGSGLVAAGTGIVMNNQMDDFSAKPGSANIFGAVGGDANAIAPKKTPLSSMSPTIVFKNGKPVLALGAHGGTRIITSVVQAILNNLFYQRDLYTSVSTARIHQQWSPDVLTLESYSTGNREEITQAVASELEALGWKIQRADSASHLMAVAREINSNAKEADFLIGVADLRDTGTSASE